MNYEATKIIQLLKPLPICLSVFIYLLAHLLIYTFVLVLYINLWETQVQSSVSKLLTSSVYIYYLTYSSTYCSPKFIDVWMSYDVFIKFISHHLLFSICLPEYPSFSIMTRVGEREALPLTRSRLDRQFAYVQITAYKLS